MHLVAAWLRALDQMGPRQDLQQIAGPSDCVAEERGGSIRVKVSTGVQARQAERPRGRGVQVLAGPGEHGPHRGLGIPVGVQQVKSPLPVRQFDHEIGKRDRAVGNGQLRGDP
jgi:hypothetical protein